MRSRYDDQHVAVDDAPAVTGSVRLPGGRTLEVVKRQFKRRKVLPDVNGWRADDLLLSVNLPDDAGASKEIKDNPAVKFLGDIAKDYVGYMLAAVGIGMVGGTISELAGALNLLRGAKLGFDIPKGLAGMTGLGDVLNGGKPETTAPKPPAGGG